MQTVVRFELLPKPTIYDKNGPRTGTNLPAVKTQITRQNRPGAPLREDFAPWTETFRGTHQDTRARLSLGSAKPAIEYYLQKSAVSKRDPDHRRKHPGDPR